MEFSIFGWLAGFLEGRFPEKEKIKLINIISLHHSISKSAMTGVPPDTDGSLVDDWGCVITDSN